VVWLSVCRTVSCDISPYLSADELFRQQAEATADTSFRGLAAGDGHKTRPPPSIRDALALAHAGGAFARQCRQRARLDELEPDALHDGGVDIKRVSDGGT
jgi:uncharacterized protein YjiS (DUF1127 family)